MLPDMSDAAPPPAGAQAKTPADPRSPAGMLVACGVAIFVATISKSWAGGRGDAFSIGPFGIESCVAGACRSLSWSEAGLGTDVSVFGTLSIVTGFAAAIACAVFGGLVLANQRGKLPSYAIGYAALGAAAFTTVLFALRLITESEQTAIGWAAVVGVGAVITGGVMLNRIAAIVPGRRAGGGPCPRCGGPMVYVASYQRWFCDRCKDYA